MFLACKALLDFYVQFFLLWGLNVNDVVRVDVEASLKLEAAKLIIRELPLQSFTKNPLQPIIQFFVNFRVRNKTTNL